MADSQFFIFVEGRHGDEYVHSNNCDFALSGMPVQYEVIRAENIYGDGSGKTRLLTHYEMLESSGQLISRLKGEVAVSVFFMDKDLDDLKGRQIDSEHVIYTTLYDVENHIFQEGDLRRAVAAACNFSPQRVRRELPDGNLWQARIAGYWKEWVRLCFAANMLRLHGESNYGRPSPLNPDPCGPPAVEKVATFERRSHAMARKSNPNGCADWNEARRQVDILYEIGRQDEVFKGKWYADILAQWLINLDPDMDKRALSANLVKHMAATMQFDSTWSRGVQEGVRKLAVKAGFEIPEQRCESGIVGRLRDVSSES
ncbi:hypothetical protein [Streptomyces sp. or20]|uniref:hypothetical protein n=1 Tax=Streptomyces sp. or20 TaxID=1828016 RepID=UPI00117F4B0B|nr:hypothetical protein [Streptomyces sp. or20]